MRIYIPSLFLRQDCSGGSYYVCSSNGFRGCCSLDPCALPNCPDSSGGASSAKSTTTASPSTTTIQQTRTVTQQTIVSTLTRTQQTTTQPVSVVATGNGSHLSSLASATATSTANPTVITQTAQIRASTTPVVIVGASGTQTTLVTATTPNIGGTLTAGNPSGYSASNGDPSASKSSSSPLAAIVGGVLGGIIVLLLIGVLMFFPRRRKKRRAAEQERIALENAVPPPYDDKTAPLPAPVKGPEPDPVPQLDSTPVRPDFELVGSTPSPVGKTSELSSTHSVRKPQELDSPRMPQTSLTPLKERPSATGLGISQPSTPRELRHVTSWQTYEGGPTREDSIRRSGMSATLSPSVSSLSPGSTPRTQNGRWSGISGSTARESMREEDEGVRDGG